VATHFKVHQMARKQLTGIVDREDNTKTDKYQFSLRNKKAKHSLIELQTLLLVTLREDKIHYVLIATSFVTKNK
jgi:hypothetical protein